MVAVWFMTKMEYCWKQGHLWTNSTIWMQKCHSRIYCHSNWIKSWRSVASMTRPLEWSPVEGMVNQDLVKRVNIPKSTKISFCEKCVGRKMSKNCSNQWEKFDQWESYNVSTVTCVDQCRHIPLEATDILPLSQMNILGVARSTSWRTSQKSLTSLRNSS